MRCSLIDLAYTVYDVFTYRFAINNIGGVHL